MLKLILFPPFNEVVGKREVEMAYAAGMTVGDTLEKLVSEYPALKKYLEKEHWEYQVMPMSAGKLIAVDYALLDGDEVMLMQPAAGG